MTNFITGKGKSLTMKILLTIQHGRWKMVMSCEHLLHYFSLYFSDGVRKTSIQSNIRTMQANEKNPLKSTADEYRKLTGIHIHIGVFGLPRLRLYFMKAIEIPVIQSDKYLEIDFSN